jgi:hypothetical protein
MEVSLNTGGCSNVGITYTSLQVDQNLFRTVSCPEHKKDKVFFYHPLQLAGGLTPLPNHRLHSSNMQKKTSQDPSLQSRMLKTDFVIKIFCLMPLDLLQ